MTKRRWHDLSGRTRRLIVLAAIAEASLKAAALVDLKRRASDQVRGPKAAWALGVTVVNSFGLAPIAYFRFGRQAQQPHRLPGSD